MPALKNPKQERYAQERASGKSQEESHKLAGYSGSRSAACQLEQNLNISARIAEILVEREQIHAQSTAVAVERAGLTKEWIVARLVENAERALQAVPVKDKDGPTGEYTYQGNVANRALELLGKELGMFIDRKETGKPGDFDRMSEDELTALALEQAKALGIGGDATESAPGQGKAGVRGKPSDLH